MDLWEVSVQDDDVVPVHECLLETGGTVVGDVCREALVPQPVGDVVGERHLVFDHENAHRTMLPDRALQGGNKLLLDRTLSRVCDLRFCQRRRPRRSRSCRAVVIRPGVQLLLASVGHEEKDMGWTGRSGRQRRSGAFAGVALVGILAAACTSSPSTNRGVASLPARGATATTAPQTTGQSDQSFVSYAHCLRSHGLVVSDPYQRPGHSGLTMDFPTPGPRTNPALIACHHFIASISAAKSAGAQAAASSALPALTRYARCMRSQDIPMLDPNPDGSVSPGNVAGINNDFGRGSPQFRAADAACRHLLPAGIHDDGTGP